MLKFQYIFQNKNGEFIKRIYDLDGIQNDLGYDILKYELGNIIARRQFTGLLDKNSKDIYDGDILKVSIEKKLCTVSFAEGAFIIGHHSGSSTRERPKLIQERFCEVIGNIYENPELLTN